MKEISKLFVVSLVLFSAAVIAGLSACNQSPFEQGKVLYEVHCSSCHMSDGTGLKNLYPSLKGNQRIWDGSLNIPCLIRNGHKSNGLGADMPGFTKMKAAEISNIMNFLHHTMNERPSVNFNQIRSQLESCKQQN